MTVYRDRARAAGQEKEVDVSIAVDLTDISHIRLGVSKEPTILDVDVIGIWRGFEASTFVFGWAAGVGAIIGDRRRK